jgi:protein SCO1
VGTPANLQLNALMNTNDDETGRVRRFFTGAGFPVFVLSAVALYEAFLLAVVFSPDSWGAWGAFSREFKVWCFNYDARTGGMEWAAVWVMLAEPLFIGLIAAFLWRRGLCQLGSWAAQRAQWRPALSGLVVSALAMAGLVAYGQPAEDADDWPPFPGERIRTELVPPEFRLDDQKGGSFALADRRGDVVLVTGVYALCGTTCPEILIETKKMIESLPLEARERLGVVALSLNPEYDTTALMDRIAEAYGFSYPQFRYLNGDVAEMNELLTLLGFSRSRNPETGMIDHANLFLLVDRRGKIAYRFTLQPRHQAWLREAILALTEEAAAAEALAQAGGEVSGASVVARSGR